MNIEISLCATVHTKEFWPFSAHRSYGTIVISKLKTGTCNSLIATHEFDGKPWSMGTRNCRHPDQWPIRSIMQMRLKMRMNTLAMLRNWNRGLIMSRCLGVTSVHRNVGVSTSLDKSAPAEDGSQVWNIAFLVGFGFGVVSCVSPDVLVRHKISLSYVRFCIMRSIVIAFTVKSKQSVKSS